MDKSVEEIENYFDSFTLFYSNSRGENIKKIFSQECIWSRKSQKI